MARAMA
jgi:hypothetical protein